MEKEIQKLIKMIKDATATFIKSFDRINGRILDMLSEPSPRVAENMKRIERMRKKLEQLPSKFTSSLKAFYSRFKEVTATVSAVHETYNDVKIGAWAQQFEKTALADFKRSLLKGGWAENVVQPIIKNLRTLTLNKAPLAALRQSLNEMLYTRGIATRYVSQVTRDVLSQHAGELHQQVATRFKFENFIYVGPIVENTRDHCRKWVAAAIHKIKDIPKMIEYARNKSGFNPMTTPDNFFSVRGGHNCGHQAIPKK